MKKENLLKSRMQQVPKDIEEFVSLSFDISDRIRDVLETKGISQKELAKLLNKRESEVSKWLKGTHNFTLETIAKIGIALDTKLFYVPTTTKSIESLSETIKCFEDLYKQKSSDEQFSNIRLVVTKQPSIYKNEESIKQIALKSQINIKESVDKKRYSIACSTNLVDYSKESTKDIFF